MKLKLSILSMKYLQMSDFVGSNNDTGEATGIFNNGDRIHLLESLVHDASTADVRETYALKPCVRILYLER